MKCVICGGDVTKKKVKEKIVIGNDVFFVNVVADTCLSCGERYFSDETMEKLAKLKKELSRSRKGAISIGHTYKVPSV